jgi:hypothetical protein
MFTDLYTGELLEPAELTSEQWKSLGDGHTELGRALLEEFGVRQMFHPHADAHVDSEASIDRFLEVTDLRRPHSASTPGTSPTAVVTTAPSLRNTRAGSATFT